MCLFFKNIPTLYLTSCIFIYTFTFSRRIELEMPSVCGIHTTFTPSVFISSSIALYSLSQSRAKLPCGFHHGILRLCPLLREMGFALAVICSYQEIMIFESIIFLDMIFLFINVLHRHWIRFSSTSDMGIQSSIRMQVKQNISICVDLLFISRRTFMR